MKALHIRKGFHPRLPGHPGDALLRLSRPSHVAMVPEGIPFIQPRLRVREGDPVSLGGLLFEDKKRPELRFLSPGGGTVTDILLGPRRSVRAIVIALADKEPREFFPTLSEEDLKDISREDLIRHLLEGGLWPLFRSLPFRAIADPAETPTTLYVSMLCHQAFAPRPSAYLEGSLQAFRFGIQVLRKLVPNLVVYTCREKSTFVLNECQGLLTHTVFGRYPAHDPGVLHYHLRQKGPAWFIAGQDVLLLSHLLETGTYPGDRTYSVGGSGIGLPSHVRTRYGAPVAHLISRLSPLQGPCRNIAGGLFTGRNAGEQGYMGMYETSIARIPEGRDREFFGFLRPGLRKPTVSRTFLSRLVPAPLPADCNTHGESRACINCSACASLCPVGILPQFTMKALHADALEEALAHGLLDCVECGLCTYACPSKIEISAILATARAKLYQEQQKGA